MSVTSAKELNDFRLLPEQIRRLNIDLADIDKEVYKISSSNSINPLTLIKQNRRLEQLIEYKKQLLNLGATQQGADLVKKILAARYTA